MPTYTMCSLLTVFKVINNWLSFFQNHFNNGKSGHFSRSDFQSTKYIKDDFIINGLGYLYLKNKPIG